MIGESILIEIDSEGAVRLTVQGVKGPSCKKVSEVIEKALGKVTADKPTSEMMERPQCQKVTR